MFFFFFSSFSFCFHSNYWQQEKEKMVQTDSELCSLPVRELGTLPPAVCVRPRFSRRCPRQISHPGLFGDGSAAGSCQQGWDEVAAAQVPEAAWGGKGRGQKWNRTKSLP